MVMLGMLVADCFDESEVGIVEVQVKRAVCEGRILAVKRSDKIRVGKEDGVTGEGTAE